MNANNTYLLKKAARRLLDAYESKNPVAPPREYIPSLDLDGAYYIQQLQEQAFTDSGQSTVGRKIGLTSIAMQQQLGVDSPDFGFFTNDMVYSDGDSIELRKFISPKVEPELAFVLSRDLYSNASDADVREAIESVHYAVEIIDSRVENWDITLVDTVADNASCGAVIFDPTPLSLSYEDMPHLSATMFVDGELMGSGTGADVMGHPLAPLRWLAQTLGGQGVPLRKGDIILTGSFCAAAPIQAGSKVTVEYGAHGKLSATFL